MSSAQAAANEPVAVGLVDTGLGVDAQAHSSILSTQARAFAWDDDNREVLVTESCADALGHGSALASTITAMAPEARLLMAQVFFQRWSTSPAQVAAAIDWLSDSGARVINLSLGLRADRAVLRDACDNALAAGVILVASSPAQGEAVFPAAYEGVIRATGDARCQASQFAWLASAQADVGACVNAVQGTVAGASVASAYVSAHIACYLEQHREAGREQVLGYLRENASYQGPERRGVEPG